jgi:hypothetical protein
VKRKVHIEDDYGDTSSDGEKREPWLKSPIRCSRLCLFIILLWPGWQLVKLRCTNGYLCSHLGVFRSQW